MINIIARLGYFLIIVPIGFVIRAIGLDPLRLRSRRRRGSHWRTIRG